MRTNNHAQPQIDTETCIDAHKRVSAEIRRLHRQASHSGVRARPMRLTAMIGSLAGLGALLTMFGRCVGCYEPLTECGCDKCVTNCATSLVGPA